MAAGKAETGTQRPPPTPPLVLTSVPQAAVGEEASRHSPQAPLVRPLLPHFSCPRVRRREWRQTAACRAGAACGTPGPWLGPHPCTWGARRQELQHLPQTHRGWAGSGQSGHSQPSSTKDVHVPAEGCPSPEPGDRGPGHRLQASSGETDRASLSGGPRPRLSLSHGQQGHTASGSTAYLL